MVIRTVYICVIPALRLVPRKILIFKFCVILLQNRSIRHLLKHHTSLRTVSGERRIGTLAENEIDGIHLIGYASVTT